MGIYLLKLFSFLEEAFYAHLVAELVSNESVLILQVDPQYSQHHQHLLQLIKLLFISQVVSSDMQLTFHHCQQNSTCLHMVSYLLVPQPKQYAYQKVDHCSSSVVILTDHGHFFIADLLASRHNYLFIDCYCIGQYLPFPPRLCAHFAMLVKLHAIEFIDLQEKIHYHVGFRFGATNQVNPFDFQWPNYSIFLGYELS